MNKAFIIYIEETGIEFNLPDLPVYKIEINKQVYEKYPKTEKEKTCWQERQRLHQLREQYKRRLISEYENQHIKI